MKPLCLLVFALVACRSARPEPIIDEPAVRPLPPASGTPIGILLDEETRLVLRPDQREKLREIDQRLATRNEHLDVHSRPLQTGPVRRPMGPRPVGTAGPRPVPPPNRKPVPHSGPSIKKVTNQAAANVRAAIAEALALLDPAQRSIAEAILRERGVLRETLRLPEPTPDASGEPTTNEPAPEQ